jgi:hypothetical protein
MGSHPHHLGRRDLEPAVKTAENSSPFISPQEMARIVNVSCGQDWVRWSTEYNCYVTVKGDRYQAGTIEDVYAGIKHDEEKANGNS